MLILVSFVGGVFYFYKGQHMLNDMFYKVDGVRKTQIVTNTSSAKRVFQKNVEASLNQMLKDVYDEMQDYRKRRKILNDIVKPRNLRDSRYIQESYKLTQETVSDLKSRSNRIIKIFDTKEAEIKALIKDRPRAAQDNILAAWNKMKSKQVSLYVQYFTIEQEILSKYQELIGLYYKNQNSVTYNQEKDQISFTSVDLNNEASQLTLKIQTLKKQQAALTK